MRWPENIRCSGLQPLVGTILAKEPMCECVCLRSSAAVQQTYGNSRARGLLNVGSNEFYEYRIRHISPLWLLGVEQLNLGRVTHLHAEGPEA